jgi:hypothetical protein
MLPSIYDAYVSVPLRIERALRREPKEGSKSARRSRSKLELGEETGS